MLWHRSIFILFSTLLLFGCSDTVDHKKESAISGQVNLLADEAFKPILEAEKAVFESLYKNTHVNIGYLPQGKVINAFLNDSTDMIISSRPFSDKELRSLAEGAAPVHQYHLATDGLAFIVNKRFNNSLTNISTLSSILSGKFTSWKQVDPVLPDQPIVVVFSQSNCADLHTAIDHFELNPKTVNIFAAGSAQKVLEHVRQNENALGIVGANLISDEEDPVVKAYRQNIKVLSIMEGEGEVYDIFQSGLANSANPFARKVHIIRRNRNAGPTSGFTAFMLSDKGQRIVLKSGVLPATMPGREILLTK